MPVTPCIAAAGRRRPPRPFQFRRGLLLAHEGSGGIPRLINQFCDRAPVYGYAERRERVDAALMAQVIDGRRGFGLSPPLREAMARASSPP